MPNSLSILSLISSEGYYGAENMLVSLVQSLSCLGCRCIVGVFAGSRAVHTEVGEQARRRGIPAETVICRGRLDWETVRHIRALMIKHNVNILHPHGYKADLYAFAASWPGRAALVATCHNWPSNLLKMRMYAALDRLVLRRFDQVIAVSDFASDILHRWGVHPDRVSTIYNGVELERFDRAVPTLRNEISPKGYSLVGFVGRLVSDKGGAFLLQAAQQVIAARPNTMFVLVGEGPARTEWEALATKLGIGKQVAFAGVRKDMPGVYASLDMVVLPSLMESMPMCLLEAMASGKPVVATRVGAVSKLVSSEENGLLLESGDKSGLVDAMLRLLGDPVFASRLGQNGRERVVQHFSAAAMARCYIRQYERVLRSRRNRTKQAQPEVSPG